MADVDQLEGRQSLHLSTRKGFALCVGCIRVFASDTISAIKASAPVVRALPVRVFAAARPNQTFTSANVSPAIGWSLAVDDLISGRG